MAGKTTRKGYLVDCKFIGGALAGQVRDVEDYRREYRCWHRVGSMVQEGKATYDLYRWDEQRKGMIYVGTVFGYGDPRTMRKLTKEQSAKLAEVHRERERQARANVRSRQGR
jgi:hypothetical protein